MAFDDTPTQATTTAAEAFALKRGVCQDLTHIFIAAARSIAIPARYIGGHFHRADGVTEQEAGHAWAEAFVPDLGWVAFDAANGICATEPMCASRSASIISAPRRCAAAATAAAARRSMSRCASTRSAARAKARAELTARLPRLATGTAWTSGVAAG